MSKTSSCSSGSAGLLPLSSTDPRKSTGAAAEVWVDVADGALPILRSNAAFTFISGPAVDGEHSLTDWMDAVDFNLLLSDMQSAVNKFLSGDLAGETKVKLGKVLWQPKHAMAAQEAYVVHLVMDLSE